MKASLGTDGIVLMSLSYFSKTLLEGIGNIQLPGYLYALTAGAGALTLGYSIWTMKDSMFDEFFKGLKFNNAKEEMPRLIKKTSEVYGHDYIFTLPAGLNIKHFEERQLSMEQFLDAKVKFIYANKKVVMKAFENKMSDYYPYEQIKLGPLEFVVGHTYTGLRIEKLKQHMLICGASGFGKSTIERGILTNIITNNKPSDVVLTLTDFKRNELGIFKRSNMVKRFCTTKEDLSELLDDLEERAIKRYESFEEKNVLDIDKYNTLYSPKMPYMINFIDEIAQLEGDKKLMSKLQKRISFDRAAGIFYVICTQRPSVDLIPGSVKANIDTRICFKTVDSTNSWIVLDDKEAAQYLSTPGRGLLRTAGKDLEEFQAMYISEDEAINLTKHTFINKQKKGVAKNDNGKGQENNKPCKGKG